MTETELFSMFDCLLRYTDIGVLDQSRFKCVYLQKPALLVNMARWGRRRVGEGECEYQSYAGILSLFIVFIVPQDSNHFMRQNPNWPSYPQSLYNLSHIGDTKKEWPSFSTNSYLHKYLRKEFNCVLWANNNNIPFVCGITWQSLA